MHTTEKTTTQKTKDDPAHDLGQMGVSIIETGFVTRILGLKVWRNAVIEGRFHACAFKPRLVSTLGRHTGNQIYYGIREEFRGRRRSGLGFIDEMSLGGGDLDAPEYLNAGSMQADGYNEASSSIAWRG